MRRIVQISLLVVACAAGLVVGRTWAPAATRAYAQRNAPPSGVGVPQGRFQVANIVVDNDRQETMMIDSQVGHVYVLVTGKDKNGAETQLLQQIPISSCMDLTCSEYSSHLHPDLDAEPGPHDKDE
jgi:hypothetical protein